MLRPSSKIIHASLVLAAVAVVFTLLRGLLVFYYFGGRFLWMASVPDKITEVNIETGDTMTPLCLREYLGIDVGKPLFNRGEGLFSCDIRNRQRKVLSLAHTLASLSVARKFGGAIDVSAAERVPLAHVAGTNFAIDGECVIFVYRKGLGQMVLIEGVPVSQLTPGRKIASAPVLSAIQLIECLADGTTAVSLSSARSIDVSRGDSVTLALKNDVDVKLAWKHMGREEFSDGRIYLEAQLNGFAGAMQDRRSRGRRHFDATIKGHCFALE